MKGQRSKMKSYFNSRPHKEVDFFPATRSDQMHNISIHDLTRRSTMAEKAGGLDHIISIHDLTRRSTTVHSADAIITVFQFTTSQGGRRVTTNNIEKALYFNSRPHKEVDQTVFADPAVDRIFQFTTSQGGRQFPYIVTLSPSTFQFTTSQGGRPFKIFKTH